MPKNKLTALIAAPLSAFAGAGAWAQVSVDGLRTIGKPASGEMGWQPAATHEAAQIHWLDGMILVIITVITLFVVVLLAWVAFRYNARRNPVPAAFTHHTPVEVAWTIVPVIILVFIGAFSLPVLFNQQEIPEGDIIIKATGNQWYWNYEYVDAGNDGVEPSSIAFDSFLLQRDQLADYGYQPDEYLLATDQEVVIPTGKVIVFQVTGADVIHSWTVPAFGVKQDAVPGRLAELWFEVAPGMEGVYFGQCSELCGKDHAYMPITVKAVTEEQYQEWLGRASQEYAGVPLGVTVAAAD